MNKIKNFTVQFLEDNQKTKKGDLINVLADSRKQALRKACKVANFPYPSPYFSLVSEKDGNPPVKKPEKVEKESKSD